MPTHFPEEEFAAVEAAAQAEEKRSAAKLPRDPGQIAMMAQVVGWVWIVAAVLTAFLFIGPEQMSYLPTPYWLLIGAGVLLPALAQHLCALTFDDDGELVDVAWEPSENSDRWGGYRPRAPEIRRLRAVASAAMAQGVFRIERDDAPAVAQRIQLPRGVDPTLGLYTAYAYHDLQRRDLIQTTAAHMARDLGAPLFDAALLSRRLDRLAVGAANTPPVLGSVPLLSQGWTLLRAFGVKLPRAAAALEPLRLPSLWTLFNPEGVARIRQAIAAGDLP